MPLCQPQPPWLMVATVRTCTTCRRVAVRLAYLHVRSRTIFWLCPDCDLTPEPAKGL
jgi:hypothetical protein